MVGLALQPRSASAHSCRLDVARWSDKTAAETRSFRFARWDCLRSDSRVPVRTFWSLPCAGQVLSRFRVHANDVSYLDESRNLHRSSRFDLCRLENIGDRGTLQGGLRFHDP